MAASLSSQDTRFLLIRYGLDFYEVLDQYGGRLLPEQSFDQAISLERLLSLPMRPDHAITVHPEDHLWRSWLFGTSTPLDSLVPILTPASTEPLAFLARSSAVSPRGFTLGAHEIPSPPDQFFSANPVPRGRLTQYQGWPPEANGDRIQLPPEAQRIFPEPHGAITHILTTEGYLLDTLAPSHWLFAPPSAEENSWPILSDAAFHLSAEDFYDRDWQDTVGLAWVRNGWAYPILVEDRLRYYGVALPAFCPVHSAEE
jgi:hypothetical protein